MPVADLSLPVRLLAGGGPSTPDPRVLRSLSLPVIGQFDPLFTTIMDDVMTLARPVFRTHNARCFPVSGLAPAGLEALLNTLLEPGDRVAIGGSPPFRAQASDIARRLGALIEPTEHPEAGTRAVVVPLVDPASGCTPPIQALASACHAVGALLLVDATLGLGACEFRVDDWHVDACSAGVDFALGAPSGLTLVTYSAEVEARMRARRSAPPTSYLDLLQLQAYWSPERLNHHTAPTSLIYGLHAALRLIAEEGLAERWQRHRQIGQVLQAGLQALGLEVAGEPPFTILRVPQSVDAARARRELLEEFGVHVTALETHAWRIGLLGADARRDTMRRVLDGVKHVLVEHTDT